MSRQDVDVDVDVDGFRSRARRVVRTGRRTARPGHARFLVPVVGPILLVGDTDLDLRGWLFVGADVAVQAAGLGMMVRGLATWGDEPASSARLRLAPWVDARSAGLWAAIAP